MKYLPYARTFLGGVLVALAGQYLTWASEMRRRGLDALLDFYSLMVATTDDMSRFIGHWGGAMRVDLGYKPDQPNRPEIAEFWETRGKLLQLRIAATKVSPFVAGKHSSVLVGDWKKLWDGFHESGSDLQKDLAFHARMWEPADQVAAMIQQGFVSFRGFLRTIVRW